MVLGKTLGSSVETDRPSEIEAKAVCNSTDFSNIEKSGLYKAIFSRRDVRSRFIQGDIPNEVLTRILNAAHHAPSVGFSQPWNFILIKDAEIRSKVKKSFIQQREKSISILENLIESTRQENQDYGVNRTELEDRKRLYLSLKLEGIVESSINLCVTYDPTKFGPFVLGRTSIPDTGVYSVCCAIQNLWLAARAEGIGVGWVSILANEDLKRILCIPPHVKTVAYLCMGPVREFGAEPDLKVSGWLPRLDLSKVIYFESWGAGASKVGSWSEFSEVVEKTKTS